MSSRGTKGRGIGTASANTGAADPQSTWILASASPRRRELLEEARVPFDVVPSTIDEPEPTGQGPAEYAVAVARAKAEDVARSRSGRWILAADTVVERDGAIFGKPRDDEDARRMLESLAGGTHRVVTAFVCLDPQGRVAAEHAETSHVSMRELEPGEIRAYVATGEPRDKAGAYAVQGKGGALVRSVDGSFTNVIGLPMEAVAAALRRLGRWPEDGIAPFAERLEAVRRRIGDAARRAGREAGDVVLVGVSKRKAPERVREAIGAGLRDVGESYVQEGVAKRRAADPEGRARWHFVGHLQRNKARDAVESFDVIQSVDRVELGRMLGRLGRELGRPVPILLQVKLGGEASKSGVDAADLFGLAGTLAGVEGLELRGLMCVPPPGASRGRFRELRELLAGLEPLRREGCPLKDLSMGMTDDFETAIEEGATLVRVGTALFGPRDAAA